MTEARGLRRHDRVGPATVRAVDGVSGSGKSTLLHLADEPTGNLDRANASETIRLLRELP